MSEFRQDIVSGDWIIMAPERAKRPDQFLEKKKKRPRVGKTGCPFDDLQKTGNWPPVISYPNEKKWDVVVIPNKFPALIHNPLCAPKMNEGPYTLTQGTGHHDLVLARDHDRNIGFLPQKTALRILLLLQERYRMLSKDKCLLYSSAFFNWGVTAGASVYHPHYQLLTLPIIPPDIQHSLTGSHEYFKKHGSCVHCEILKYESKIRSRIIWENAHAVAIAPFASRRPFQVKVFPKRHLPFFEDTPHKDLAAVLSGLQTVLQRFVRYIDDPDLNFFIHTSPLKDRKNYRHYHWHIEIVPKLVSPPGGFEVGTGTDINVISPELATQIMRTGKLDR